MDGLRFDELNQLGAEPSTGALFAIAEPDVSHPTGYRTYSVEWEDLKNAISSGGIYSSDGQIIGDRNVQFSDSVYWDGGAVINGEFSIINSKFSLGTLSPDHVHEIRTSELIGSYLSKGSDRGIYQGDLDDVSYWGAGMFPSDSSATNWQSKIGTGSAMINKDVGSGISSMKWVFMDNQAPNTDNQPITGIEVRSENLSLFSDYQESLINPGSELAQVTVNEAIPPVPPASLGDEGLLYWANKSGELVLWLAHDTVLDEDVLHMPKGHVIANNVTVENDVVMGGDYALGYEVTVRSLLNINEGSGTGINGMFLKCINDVNGRAQWGHLPGPFYGLEFDSDTSKSNPGFGKFKVNSVIQQNVDEIYINDSAINGGSIDVVLENQDKGGVLVIQKKADNKTFVCTIEGSIVDEGGYYSFPVSHNNSLSGVFEDGEDYDLFFYQKEKSYQTRTQTLTTTTFNVKNGWNCIRQLTTSENLTFVNGEEGANGIIKLINTNGLTLDLSGAGLTFKRLNGGVLEAYSSITLQAGAVAEQILTYTYITATEVIFEVA